MASQDTDPKVEEVTGDNQADDEQMPELESQPKEEKKLSKGEKKCRKQLSKLNLRSQGGITRVTLKRRDGIIFVISNPEVFKSPTSENSFVILGELKMDEPRLENLPTQVPYGAPGAKPAAAKAPTETSKVEEVNPDEQPTASTDAKEEDKKEDAPAKVEEVQDDGEDDGPLDESGLTPMHIEMVMQNGHCTRNQAIKALRETNNDMVNAIMLLTK